MNQTLIHDVAHVIALHLLQVVEGCLRDEEKQRVFEAFYEVVKAGLDAYQVQSQRMLERLNKPRRN